MVESALQAGTATQLCVFEIFTRGLPALRAYGVVAGIDRVVDAVQRFRFDEQTVGHLQKTGVVQSEVMGNWLREYRFGGDITGYAEGELFFPYSPVLTVSGGFAECVVLETVLLSILNHDCAVASAAARVADAAAGKLFVEGGSRRTDLESAVAAARAAHVGGFAMTSNLEAGRRHGIPTAGTTAHAFVLAHDSETEAFRAQLATLGASSTYLVDTFDVAEGIRNAVAVVGTQIGAVRIDSGDLFAESRAARRLLDRLGAHQCQIVVSGDLDEFTIDDLEKAGAPIDTFLVGTSLVTGSGHPTASMVYKLVAVASADRSAPLRAVGKLSPNKRTVGGQKTVYRTFGPDGFFNGEVLSVLPVEVPQSSMCPQIPIFRDGEVVMQRSDVAASRARCLLRRERLQPQDRTPWPQNSPAVPTIWQGIEEPLLNPNPQGKSQA